ncbi:MAG: energy transducer TonB [Candidatus Amulumruptor caecigallinarius]|nr:energy transducer TonB [Candidatus Amulumruptor caecigallinarius]MCM1396938.1 energy transducer TonB [Candidatus Amulumruptor caecigallinarius]MCM1454118.1 energy transducer TonB [bacterium]
MTHLYLLRLSLFTALATCPVLAPGASAQLHKTQQRISHADRPQQQPAIDVWQVDEEPAFPGGERGLLRFINEERRYPDAAYEAGISGRVLCSFTIGEDGAVSDIRVVRSVEQTLDREAVRIISRMPRWSPAHVEGEAVSVTYFLPIPFRL